MKDFARHSRLQTRDFPFSFPGALVVPQDTFGISEVLRDYTVETTFQKLADSSTKVEISHYYSTPTLKARLLNLIAGGQIARETHATLTAIKAVIRSHSAFRLAFMRPVVMV